MLGSDAEPITADQAAALDRIKSIVTRSLGVNAAQWTHFACNDDQQRCVMQWCQPQTDRPMASLLFYVLPNATLQAAAFLPANRRFTKATYFIKTKASRVVGTNFMDIVLHGDMPANLVAFGAHTLHSVFGPLLSNRWLRVHWPVAICEDIDAHLLRSVRQLNQVVDEAPFGGARRSGSLRKFELSSTPAALSALAAAVRDYRRFGVQRTGERTRQIVEQIVIDVCIDLERALKQQRHIARTAACRPPSNLCLMSDECTRWQGRWLALLAVNDALRTLNATDVCDMMRSLGSAAYLSSFETMLRMVQDETAAAIDALAVLKSLAHQLRAIQNAQLGDIADTVAPIMHCWTAAIGDGDCNRFGDCVRICCAICNEFSAEIRRTLDAGGLAQFQQTHATDVQRFAQAEQIVLALRASLWRLQSSAHADGAAALAELRQRLQRFAQRVRQLRRILEGARDFQTLEKLARVCAAGAAASSVSACRLLHVVDIQRRSVCAFWVNSSADWWDVADTTAADAVVEFEQRVRAFDEHVQGLMRTVVDGFPVALDKCGCVEQCRQILPFIEDLHSDHLRQQLHSQWESRYRSVYRLELDRIIVTAERLLQFEPSAFESHSDIIRVDGFLDYPSVANQLLAARALHGRLMATFIPTDEWTVEHEPSLTGLLERLARFEDDTVGQFLVAYQHFETGALVDELLPNLLVVSRLRLNIAADLQAFLEQALQLHRT